MMSLRVMRLLVLAALISVGALSSSQALAELELELIFAFDGDSNGANMGYCVQSPGDLNGDGFSEVFVAASAAYGANHTKVFNGGDPAPLDAIRTYRGVISYPCWTDDLNNDGYRDFGTSYLVPGEIYQTEIYFGGENFYSKTIPDLVIPSEGGKGFNSSLWTEDYDADGCKELILRQESYLDYPLEAKFYFFEIGVDLDSLADDTLRMFRDEVGPIFAVACIGDVNGDGYADFAGGPHSAAEPSYVHIFYGSSDLNSEPDLTLWSPFEDGPGYGYFGNSINPVGDLNWDGYDDFIVTHSVSSPCIYYGGDPIDTIPKILEYPADVANICGDINHDGWEDIAVGWTSWGFGEGRVFVYFGARDMDTIADITLRSEDMPALWHFGQSVGPAGDFNGDGVDDLAVGAQETQVDKWNNGRLYVFAGDSSLPTPADEIDDEEILPEQSIILHQNYPNPFNQGTTICFTLLGKRERHVELIVYNLLGRKVQTLVDEEKSAGNHEIRWDGTDDNGNDVPSGVYFYTLKSDDQSTSRKLLLLK